MVDAPSVAAALIYLIKELVGRHRKFKNQYNRLERSLERLVPILRKLPAGGELDALCGELERGQELIRECGQVSFWNPFKRISYSQRLKELAEAIEDFVKIATSSAVLRLSSILEEVNSKLTRLLVRSEPGMRPTGSRVTVPHLDGGKVFGIEKPLMKLKELLGRRQVVGVCGMGGCGKTTLVNMFCKDEQLQVLFGGNIFWFTVSRSPDTLDILKGIWSRLLVEEVPKFGDVEDAAGQVRDGLISKQKKNSGHCLIVLDDVWSEKDLKNLLFYTEHLKTIFTSREVIKIDPDINGEIYSLPRLEEAAAKELLYHTAGKPSPIYTSAAEQIITRCGGLPLALRLIGRRLNGEPIERWEEVKKDLLNEGEIYKSEEDLLRCFSKTIDSLSPELRECFLDLGCVPEDKRLPAASIIDVWVELYGLTEKKAFLKLFELSEKYLLSLTWRTRSETIGGGNYQDLVLSQHDLLRDLALHCWTSEGRTARKRLGLNRKEGGKSVWSPQEIEALDAEIVSFEGDSELLFIILFLPFFLSPFKEFSRYDLDLGCEANYSKWSGINFRDAKVLMLNLSADTYQLPPFLRSMENLKALIITNHSLDQAKLSKLQRGGSAFRNLRRMRLEKLSIPGFFEIDEAPFLEKLTFFFCKFGPSTSDLTAKNICVMFPELKTLEIHYATDLEQLHPAVCEMRKLQNLSITKCPDLKLLPQGMGQLSNLKYLNLYACSSLEGLPDSICELKNLKVLDVCDCPMIEGLPENVGSLSCLKEIDMRRCSTINEHELPTSVTQMRVLNLVLCDEEAKRLWDHEAIETAFTGLQIYAPKEETDLRFLQ